MEKWNEIIIEYYLFNNKFKVLIVFLLELKFLTVLDSFQNVEFLNFDHHDHLNEKRKKDLKI